MLTLASTMEVANCKVLTICHLGSFKGVHGLKTPRGFEARGYIYLLAILSHVLYRTGAEGDKWQSIKCIKIVG